MKAQVNKVNEGAVVVSLYNEKRVVSQKWFDSERKANNFVKKYNYEVCNMPETIDCSEKFNH